MADDEMAEFLRFQEEMKKLGADAGGDGGGAKAAAADANAPPTAAAGPKPVVVESVISRAPVTAAAAAAAAALAATKTTAKTTTTSVISKPPQPVGQVISKPPRPAGQVISNPLQARPPRPTVGVASRPPQPPAPKAMGQHAHRPSAPPVAYDPAAAAGGGAYGRGGYGGGGGGGYGGRQQQQRGTGSNSVPVADMSQPKKKRKFRAAGGKVWTDQTLDEWPEDDYRIFVGDMGNEVTDGILAAAFDKYKSFAKAKVIRDKHNRKSKGFGFVSFLDPFDMLKALKEMNGKYCGNRPMKLRKSTWKDRQVKGGKRKVKRLIKQQVDLYAQ